MPPPPTWSSACLTLAVLEPTIGCRQYADRLGDQGFAIAKSTVQKHLVTHGLGTTVPAPGPGGGHHGGHDRPCDRGGPGGRALRVLPGQRWSGRARLPGQLLRREAERRGQGVPAHRHRRLHPLGLCGIVLGTVRRRRHAALHRPAAAPLPAPRGQVPSRPQRQRARVHGDGLPAHLAAKGLRHVASRPARPTTTPSSSASTARSSKSAGDRPSTAGASPRSASSRPRPTPGSSPTTSRRNHGDYMRGRTPQEILDSYKRHKAA